MNIKFTIYRVNSPSEKQLQSGILGTAEIHIVNTEDNTIITRLPDITIRKSGQGTRFLSMPSRKNPKGGYIKYYDIFPLKGSAAGVDNTSYNNIQKERNSKITQEVLRLLDENTKSPAQRTDSSSNWV